MTGMKLQGRTLTHGQTGADIKELHEIPARLGYPIPEAERHVSQFGDGTLAATRAFQADAGTAATSERRRRRICARIGGGAVRVRSRTRAVSIQVIGSRSS
jgi:hypothetical protein